MTPRISLTIESELRTESRSSRVTTCGLPVLGRPAPSFLSPAVLPRAVLVLNVFVDFQDLVSLSIV